MAKDAGAKNTDGAKKKKKPADVTVAVRVKSKKGQGGKSGKGEKAKSDRAGKSSARAGKGEGFEGLAKFVDHPLVADLLAAGAMAAVAAIAEHQLSNKGEAGSSKMVKSVGKAAASAMGRKLMSDIGAITTAATDAAKKA